MGRIRRWLRRLLGLDDLERRLEALEGHRPEGDWYKRADPATARKEVGAVLDARDPIVRPGPSGDAHHEFYWVKRPWAPQLPTGLYL